MSFDIIQGHVTVFWPFKELVLAHLRVNSLECTLSPRYVQLWFFFCTISWERVMFYHRLIGVLDLTCLEIPLCGRQDTPFIDNTVIMYC